MKGGTAGFGQHCTQSTPLVTNARPHVLVQVGAERYNLFKGCPRARTATMVLRGGSEQFIDEAERSLHDAIMIVRRAMKNASVVPGGGAIDMQLSRWGHSQSWTSSWYPCGCPTMPEK